MPQAVPFIVGAAGATSALAAAGIALLQTAALGLIQRALMKKPGSGSFPLNITIRSTVAARRLVWGTVRAGGAILFVGTSGTKEKYLWFVVAYAGHQCEALKDLYLDKFKIADADINGSTGVVSTASLDGKLMCWDHLGTQAQAVDSNLDSAFTEWTSAHRLRGTTYRVLRMERSDKAFPTGAPSSVNSVVDGALLYDPRLDTTNGGSGSHRTDDPRTWEFSNNPALVLRWFLTGGSVINDQATRLIMYGLRESDDRIPDDYTIATANICDESISGGNAPPSGAQVRFTCDLEVSTDQTRREIIELILATMGPGQLVPVHGRWRMFAAAYDAPSHAFDETDLADGLDVEDTTADDERVNQLSAIYIDAAKDYTEQSTVVRTNAAYVTQDGGQEKFDEITLRGVTDEYRAQRLAELALRRSRQMRRLRIPFGRQGLKVAPWETFTLDYPRYGWSGRVFRCVVAREIEYTPQGGIICWVTAQAETTAIYTDLDTADYTTGTSVTNALQSDDIDEPTSLVATTRHGSIEFTWSLGEFWQTNGISELWEYTSNTPFSSATKIWEGRSTRVVINKTDVTTRYYWVRVRSIGGKVSSTEPSGNGLAGVAYYAVMAPSVTDTPSDGSINYTAGVQPRVETSGIASHISYTSPASIATRCLVNYAGQANIDNTTSGVATGYAVIECIVQVNGGTVLTRNTRLEACLSGNDAWGVLAGSKAFDVPAGQTIDVYLNVGRNFSTGGASPAQNIYWRGCMTEIVPTKQT